jgi:F-type H+-transporting ATPase subunit gamma
MATLRQLRRRIRSAKNIQQITRAMKLVAAARLRRAQDAVLQARPYAQKMYEMLAYLGEATERPDHPLLAVRPIQRYGVVLITAERGLCGSFNSNLIRKAQELVNQTPGEPRFYCVGAKGRHFCLKRGYPVELSVSIPTSGPKPEHAKTILSPAESAFLQGEIDALYVVYSRFYSAIRQSPEVTTLLPIQPPPSTGELPYAKVYQFEPAPQVLLSALLPRYAFTVIWQALLESCASEHGARMTAMTNATDNAGEMIAQLTLLANRSRQAAITKEILEVVAGAEALKG